MTIVRVAGNRPVAGTFECLLFHLDPEQAVTFGFGELYQLPPVLRAEPFSGQTVLGKPARGGRVGSPTA